MADQDQLVMNEMITKAVAEATRVMIQMIVETQALKSEG